jgi:hypothetical protein
MSPSGWLYIAILFVPAQYESPLMMDLLNLRCGNLLRQQNWGDCDIPCDYHSRNDTEVHFSEIRDTKSSHKFDIAYRWVDYFMGEVEKVYFYVLGLDLNKMDHSYFGMSKTEVNIYNRFFRTAIQYATKSFFNKYSHIVITDIIHDQCDSKEDHKYFPWHSISIIEGTDPKIHFECSNIIFVNSDHRKPDGNQYSHLLQFTELILWFFRMCLDYDSKDSRKVLLAKKTLSILTRLMYKPNNWRSSYKYFNRLKIEYFPRHDIRQFNNADLIAIKRFDSFYTERDLAICIKGKQNTLFEI